MKKQFFETNKMPQVSIIVPVYNAEKTMERCIQSILDQSYKDLELILLDDGSEDDSGRICDVFAQKDERIRVLHKENSGVSDTRNQAIAMARGEYLQFVDSDDWLAPDATRFFMRTVTEHQCDMIIADFYRVIGERVAQKGDIEKDGMMDRASYAACMLQKPADFYYGVLWNKFYKKSIIDQYEIKMDTAVSWCEDFIFNMEYVRHIDTVFALKMPVYYYVKTKESLVSQGFSMKKTIQMKRMVFTYYNRFYRDVLGEEDYERRKGQIYRFLFDIAGDGMVSPLSLSPSHRLGNERTNVSEGIKTGEGIFFDLYREKKLQERLFDIVALRNDLTTSEVMILYYLSQSHEDCTRKDMANVLSISGRQLSLSLQRLLAKELIAVSEEKEMDKAGEVTKEYPQGRKKRANKKRYIATQEAESILSEIVFVLCDLEQIQYEGFSQEEIELYERLDELRKNNIRKALRT